MLVHVTRAVALVLFAAPPVVAQGSDLCSSAEAIAGFGQFAFDTTAASTDGQPDSACEKSGNTQIEGDVWFAWTSPHTGNVRISTCGLAGFDTMLAVYRGTGCLPASLVACDDDSGCGSTSSYSSAER